jgi:hypothetical protein
VVTSKRILVALVMLGFATIPVLTGCPEKENPPPPADAGFDATSVCPTGFLGDPSKEPIIELRALLADGSDVPIAEGDDLAIIFPPQGGRVAFVGVRATNIDGCGVQVTGTLRDRSSKQIRFDGRTVNLRREPDGFGTTGRGTKTNIEDSAEIGDYSNIPLCPNQWADEDVFDRPYDLEVEVVDRQQKKKVVKTIGVVPRCAEPGAKETACRCLCKKGYVGGESCGEDAGVEAGTK